MFDSDNRASILTGGLIRNAAVARRAQRDASDATTAASQANSMAAGLAGLLERDQADLVSARARIAELELALLVKTAHAEGLEAQKKGYIAAHQGSPERRDSGKRYKSSGNAKTISSLRYEAAFDAFLIGKGIANPAKHRAD